MFGNSNPMPSPPPLPDPLPATPQYASGAGKIGTKGKPYGGTLLTSPLAAPAPEVPVARKSLLGN